MRSLLQELFSEAYENARFEDTLKRLASDAPHVNVIKGAVEGSLDRIRCTEVAARATVKLGEGSMLLDCIIGDDVNLTVGPNTIIAGLKTSCIPNLRVGANNVIVDTVARGIVTRDATDEHNQTLCIGDNNKVLDSVINLVGIPDSLSLGDNNMIYLNRIVIDHAHKSRIGSNNFIWGYSIKVKEYSDFAVDDNCSFVPRLYLNRAEIEEALKDLCVGAMQSAEDSRPEYTRTDMDITMETHSQLHFARGSKLSVCLKFEPMSQLDMEQDAVIIPKSYLNATVNAGLMLKGGAVVQLKEGACLSLPQLNTEVEASAFQCVDKNKRVPSLLINQNKVFNLRTGTYVQDYVIG